MTKTLIVTVEDPILPLRNLMIVTMAGVAAELGLPIIVNSGMDREHGPFIGVHYPDTFNIQPYKEEFRATLIKRGLDQMFNRRIMRILFATTVEEP